MSAPFTVAAVGVRPLGGDDALEVVGAHVGGKLAGTFIVDRGHGEPLARLLLSSPIVEAARKAASHYRGFAGLRDLEGLRGALAELAAAIKAVDERGTDDDVPLRRLEPVPPRALQYGVDPAKEVVQANNRLFFGNPEGKGGNSVFRASAVAGVVLIPTPTGPRPRPYGTFEGALNALECWPSLSGQLRELADGIDRQLAAAKLVGGR